MKKVAYYFVIVIAAMCVLFTARVLINQSSVVQTWAYQKGSYDKEVQIMAQIQAAQQQQVTKVENESNN